MSWVIQERHNHSKEGVRVLELLWETGSLPSPRIVMELLPDGTVTIKKTDNIPIKWSC